MAKKITTEFVRGEFERAGYRMLGEYVSSGAKIDFICDKEHRHSIAWSKFRMGRRCAKCAGQVVTHEQVEARFKAEGYQLLDRYKNSGTTMLAKCPAGHDWRVNSKNFLSGNRCVTCAGQIVTHKEVELAFNAAGYTLLSPYLRSGDNMQFICNRGHRRSMCWESFKAGRRCLECTGKIVSPAQVRVAFEQEGYQLLEEYQREKKKLKYVCPDNHTNAITWGHFRRGRRCPDCATYGFKSSLPAILYYLRINPLDRPYTLYKIGITNNSVYKRFERDFTKEGRELMSIDILSATHFPIGKDARTEEQRLHKLHAAHRYFGPDILRSNGNTELFTCDVLGLDPDSKVLPFNGSIPINGSTLLSDNLMAIAG
jgi:hypothetical protein